MSVTWRKHNRVGEGAGVWRRISWCNFHWNNYQRIKVIGGSSINLSQTTNFRLFQTKRVCRRQFLTLMKMAESFPKGQKTLREKEKLLVTTIFSFSHSDFKRLTLQTRKNQGLFGKGLRWFKRFWSEVKLTLGKKKGSSVRNINKLTTIDLWKKWLQAYGGIFLPGDARLLSW